MGDEEQRHAHLGLQLVEKVEDLGLDRHVQRGGRLVADQQLRPAGQGHRDHRALPLATRQLVRKSIDTTLGFGNAGARQQLDGAGARRVRPQRGVQLEHLADLVAYRVQRVERGHRLLEDHADAPAADAAHLALGFSDQVLALEADRSGGHRSVHQAQHRQRGDRLTRAGLANQGELLAGGDREGDVVDDRRWRRSARSACRSRAAGGAGAHDLRVSKASRSASPMKVSSSIVTPAGEGRAR
jgi:hypothetical protein